MHETHGDEGKHHVRVHIDQKRYDSHTPTNGAALYELGHVEPGLKLYREVEGDHEDPPIENCPEIVHLKEDEHFHSAKPTSITIIVEGTPDQWSQRTINYAEIVTLYDPQYPQHPDVTYSVKYKRGPRQKPEGILSPGASVKVREGMVFNVCRTGQS